MASIFKRAQGGAWVIEYSDAQGRRRRKSTGTTDKRAAERIAAKLDADVALRRLGVVDARLERIAAEGQRPLRDHISEYIAHCRRAEQAPQHVVQKERQLLALVNRTGAARLSELTADALERDLKTMRGDGASARTVNFKRQIVVAFMNWCVRANHAEVNPLRSVPRLDESGDKRRVRRALTESEAARLLEATEQSGRKSWYLTALFGGLRKGELRRLTWGDVDFDLSALNVRNRKGKRDDQIAMHRCDVTRRA